MRAKWFLCVACLTAVLMGAYASYTQAARQDAPVLYFKTVPVDPRALFSGDYMALAYEVENNNQYDLWGRGALTLYAGENDVVQCEKTDRVVKIPFYDGSLKLPHQFYFEEGTGAKYEGAAYAKMRLLPDGRFLIDGLTDEKFNEIK